MVSKFSFLLTSKQSVILWCWFPHSLSILPLLCIPPTRPLCKPSASLSWTTYSKSLVTNCLLWLLSTPFSYQNYLPPVTNLNILKNIRSLLVVTKWRQFMINSIQSSFQSGTCLYVCHFALPYFCLLLLKPRLPSVSPTWFCSNCGFFWDGSLEVLIYGFVCLLCTYQREPGIHIAALLNTSFFSLKCFRRNGLCH